MLLLNHFLCSDQKYYATHSNLVPAPAIQVQSLQDHRQEKVQVAQAMENVISSLILEDKWSCIPTSSVSISSTLARRSNQWKLF